MGDDISIKRRMLETLDILRKEIEQGDVEALLVATTGKQVNECGNAIVALGLPAYSLLVSARQAQRVLEDHLFGVGSGAQTSAGETVN